MKFKVKDDNVISAVVLERRLKYLIFMYLSQLKVTNLSEYLSISFLQNLVDIISTNKDYEQTKFIRGYFRAFELYKLLMFADGQKRSTDIHDFHDYVEKNVLPEIKTHGGSITLQRAIFDAKSKYMKNIYV